MHVVWQFAVGYLWGSVASLLSINGWKFARFQYLFEATVHTHLLVLSQALANYELHKSLCWPCLLGTKNIADTEPPLCPQMRGPFLWSQWRKLLVKWLYVLGYTCPVVPAWTEPPFHPAGILDGAINQMITLAISVHAYGTHRWYSSADLRQLSDYCATFVCLSFWCHIRKQIISQRTQIIGEKPQTVSGPLWVIIHPIVVLALMMVSCAVQKVIYAARHCLMGLQHWGKVEGGVQGIVTSPLLSSFTSISDPPPFVRGCGFSVIPFRWS